MRLTSLRARLLVPTLTLSLLVMAGAVAVGATLTVRNLSAAFEKQVAHKVEFAAMVGTRFLTTYYDLTALGLFVKELSRDEEVAFAEFFDAAGKSLTADVMKSPADTTRLLLVEREMKDDLGKTVGRLKVGFRADSVAVARNLVLGAIGGGMLAVLVVVSGLLLWSVRYVMKVIGSEPRDAVAVADRIASGDLTRDLAVASGDVTSLTSALMRMQKQLQQIVGEIRRASTSIEVSSTEIAQGHTDLSTRTEEQASSLEETAASMEQMTATVSQNAENAKKANQLATGASEVASRGGRAVATVVSTMSGISNSSKKIADIIGVIDGIAFQTNILALNAAVEAARAGEQGRGFAVVASEVRNLAQRSAGAAKEIRQLILDSVGRIEDGARQVEAAGETMGEVVASVQRVTDLIAEIAAASQEQSQSLSQVSDTVQQLEKMTQQNAAMVEEATAASASLEEQAAVLMRAAGGFKLAEEGLAAALARQAPSFTAPAAAPKAAPKAKSPALPRHAPRQAAAALKAPKTRAAGGKDKADEGWEEF